MKKWGFYNVRVYYIFYYTDGRYLALSHPRSSSNYYTSWPTPEANKEEDMLIWIMGIIAVVVVVEVILLYLYLRTINKLFHDVEREAMKYKRAEEKIATDKIIRELREEAETIRKESRCKS